MEMDEILTAILSLDGTVNLGHLIGMMNVGIGIIIQLLLVHLLIMILKLN